MAFFGIFVLVQLTVFSPLMPLPVRMLGTALIVPTTFLALTARTATPQPVQRAGQSSGIYDQREIHPKAQSPKTP
ncbi:MAG: hypothetical protein ACFB20_11640 [Opitutales bacterium]